MPAQLVIKENTGDGYVTVFKATFADAKGEEIRNAIDRLGDATFEATDLLEATVQVDTKHGTSHYNVYGQVTHTE